MIRRFASRGWTAWRTLPAPFDVAATAPSKAPKSTGGHSLRGGDFSAVEAKKKRGPEDRAFDV